MIVTDKEFYQGLERLRDGYFEAYIQTAEEVNKYGSLSEAAILILQDLSKRNE